MRVAKSVLDKNWTGSVAPGSAVEPDVTVGDNKQAHCSHVSSLIMLENISDHL